MILRVSKTLLVLAVALYYTIVVFNNTTDYDSNFQFVRHVLMMDSTFPNNSAMWRAINSPSVHTLFYVTVITWEAITMILCWWGGIKLVRNLKTPAQAFQYAKNTAIIGTNARRAVVADCISNDRRRMVLDVAVAEVERSGSRLPHVRNHGNRFNSRCDEGRRTADVVDEFLTS